jgi:molecular chaperone IbpA
MTTTIRTDFPFRDMMIGFDEFFSTADRLSGNQKYPPYNIEKTSEDSYLIEIALAGWTEDLIDIEEHNGNLTVKGTKGPEDVNNPRDYIYKGIGGRAFTREFKLIEHMRVSNANLNNGILSISLEVDIPEALKPRKINLLSNSIKGQKPSNTF